VVVILGVYDGGTACALLPDNRRHPLCGLGTTKAPEMISGAFVVF
jgi:hypothetical protein